MGADSCDTSYAADILKTGTFGLGTYNRAVDGLFTVPVLTLELSESITLETFYYCAARARTSGTCGSPCTSLLGDEMTLRFVIAS